MRPSFGVLREPAPADPAYLETLHQWGSLPDVVPIPDAAGLLARLTGQNASALLKVLQEAVLHHEIAFWGLSHGGGWVEGMHRTLLPLSEQPRIEEGADSETIQLVASRYGRPHFEAMGIRPSDAVRLLVKRGRKVPDELLGLLREGTDPAAAASATRAPRQAESPETKEQRQDRRLARFKELGGELRRAGSGWQVRGKRGALSRLVEEEQRDGRPYRQRADVKRDLEAAAERLESQGA